MGKTVHHSLLNIHHSLLSVQYSKASIDIGAEHEKMLLPLLTVLQK